MLFVFSFLQYYGTYPSLLSMLSELTGQCYPNLLPVAGGGGAPTLTLCATVPYTFSYIQNPLPRAFGIYVLMSVTISVTFQERLRTIYLEVSYPFSVTISFSFVNK